VCFRLYFSQQQAQVAQRRRRSAANNKEGRNLWVAVEATVREVKHPIPAGKLPVRGKYRMNCMLISFCASLNFAYPRLVGELTLYKTCFGC
jgi:hypothetical protein